MALPDGFLDAARALIAADSVSSNGNLAAVEVLEPLWAGAGFATRRLPGGPRDANLLVGPMGAAAAPGGLLLVTHLDTVPAGTGWQTPPLQLVEKDGWLFGRGVADVKLDALCKLEAARLLRGEKLARPFWWLGTFGEEVGLLGAKHFTQSDNYSQISPTFVLCGEPSELLPIYAHKGYAVVRATVTDAKARTVLVEGLAAEELTWAGKAAHSSTPHLGVNAIARALAWSQATSTPVFAARGGTSANVVPAQCTLVVASPRDTEERALPATGGGRMAGAVEPAPRPDEARLSSLPREERPNLWRALASAAALGELWQELLGELKPARDERFDPPGAVGGLNVLASEGRSVSATFDARLLPEHDPDALIARFRERATQWIERLGRGELSCEISVERNAGGMAMPIESPLIQTLSRTLNQTPKAKPTSTEGGVFARAGAQAAVFGPGVSTGNAHTANERIEVAQLERAIKLYAELIRALCGS